MRGSMRRFESGAREAIEMLVLEVRRAIDWIEEDRRRYWPALVRRAEEKLVEARSALERCQLTYGSEEAPSCHEQKKAFERARRRLRRCEEKVKLTQRWIRTVRQEVSDFEGQVAQLTNFLDSDVPRAVAALERMLAALEKYTAQHGGDRTSAIQRSATADEASDPES